MPLHHDNESVFKERIWSGADGPLMPAHKGQQPPDLRYFKETRK